MRENLDVVSCPYSWHLGGRWQRQENLCDLEASQVYTVTLSENKQTSN